MAEHTIKHSGTYQWKSGAEYVGEFKNGIPHGRGVMVFPNGNRYVGTFVDGKRQGRGTFTWASKGVSSSNLSALLPSSLPNGDTTSNAISVSPSGYALNSSTETEESTTTFIEQYTGDFLANERHGYGIYQSANGDIYEGDFLNGVKQGDGVLKYLNGDIYRGQFSNGRRDGFGRMEYSNGNSFEGHWHADKRSGKGIFHWTNGDRYEGDYLEDKQRGEGTLYLSNGDTYTGSFSDNRVSGFACYNSPSKGTSYEGNFLDGHFHGHGMLVLADGSFYEGGFSHGSKHGNGIGFHSETEAIFSEEWKNNSLVSRLPVTISYDARSLMTKKGLTGPVADKIVDLRPRAPTEPAPYSITKEALSASGRLKKSGRSGSKSGSKSSIMKDLPQLKLHLNLTGALTEKGGIPTDHYKVILYITSFFTVQDLVTVAQVCKAWKFFMADSDIVWEILCKRKWPQLHPISSPLLRSSWKLLYRTKNTLYTKDQFRHGFGTFYWPNGNKYEGEWVDNKRHGAGVMTYGNKDVFYGDFRDGRKHGSGVYKFFNGTIYDAQWEKGRLHGNVKIQYSNGDSFVGVFYRGEKMGPGTMRYAKGEIASFVGQWRRGRREGNGTEITRTGEHHHAIWLNGNPIVEHIEEPVLAEEWEDWDSPSQIEDERAYYRRKRASKMVKRGLSNSAK